VVPDELHHLSGALTLSDGCMPRCAQLYASNLQGDLNERMDRNEGMDRSKFSVNMTGPMSIVIDVRLRLTRALDRHQYDLPHLMRCLFYWHPRLNHATLP